LYCYLPPHHWLSKRAGGREAVAGAGNLYDQDVETIKGEVVKIDEFTLAQGMPQAYESF